MKNFFDAPACLPIGPVRLSLSTGAPLVGAYSWRSPGAKITGTFVRLTRALPEDERTQEDLVEEALIK